MLHGLSIEGEALTAVEPPSIVVVEDKEASHSGESTYVSWSDV